jgi:hypothetical protein
VSSDLVRVHDAHDGPQNFLMYMLMCIPGSVVYSVPCSPWLILETLKGLTGLCAGLGANLIET